MNFILYFIFFMICVIIISFILGQLEVEENVLEEEEEV
tara:strand:+ start:1218 stop:1331 length:114 start_codon:yes stop_codon:yes gene_type:complete